MRTLPVAAVTVVLLAACRPGEGGRCICQGECRDGLVCAVGGTVLGKGRCVDSVTNDLEAGECVPHGNTPDDGDPLDFEPHFDLGTKRDFEPGGADMDTSSGSTSVPEDTSTTSSTSATTDATTTGSSDTTSTDTGTETTDATSTGTTQG